MTVARIEPAALTARVAPGARGARVPRGARIRRVAAVLVLALAFAAVGGCDDGDPVGLEVSVFAGFWNATRFSYDDDTGTAPGFGIDVIDAGGTITLDIQATGDFTGTIAVPGVTSDPETGQTVSRAIGGTLSLVDEDRMSVDFDADTEALPGAPLVDFEADFVLSGNVLTLTYGTTLDFPDDLEVDFLGTARGEVPVTVDARFQR